MCQHRSVRRAAGRSGLSDGAAVDTEMCRPLASAAIRVLSPSASKHGVRYEPLKILLEVKLC